MELQYIDLSIIWILIIGFAVIMYVILDGFDLGLGILFPFVKDKADRDLMMNTVAPVWDGNETWLILGGAGLFAAFNKAYALILPALYFPLMLFLGGLVLRGVSFEFRFKSTKEHRNIWDYAFSFGSILATFMQGIVLGAFVVGFPVVKGQFFGHTFWWLQPFTIMTGFALLIGYALLGSTWLVMKTEGHLQQFSRKISIYLVFALVFFIVLVSVWTPILQPAVADRWFSWPDILFFAPVPLDAAILVGILLYALRHKNEILPFLCSIGLFLLSFSGLIISLWPYIVPRSMTIWEAASAPESQLFTLCGVLFLLPIILAYTAHSYWVFRGKIRSDDAHYH